MVFAHWRKTRNSLSPKLFREINSLVAAYFLAKTLIWRKDVNFSVDIVMTWSFLVLILAKIKFRQIKCLVISLANRCFHEIFAEKYSVWNLISIISILWRVNFRDFHAVHCASEWNDEILLQMFHGNWIHLNCFIFDYSDALPKRFGYSG